MQKIERRSFLVKISKLALRLSTAQAAVYVVGQALPADTFDGRLVAGAKGLSFEKGIELAAPCAACDTLMMGPYASPAACETARMNWITSGSPGCAFCRSNYTSPSCE